MVGLLIWSGWPQVYFELTGIHLPAAFIEKTANDGLEEHHNMLRKVLLDWTAGDGGAVKRRRKKRRPGSETDGYATEATEAARAGSGT